MEITRGKSGNRVEGYEARRRGEGGEALSACILVVDEDASVCEAVATALAAPGIRIVCASSVAGALEHLAKKRFDLVISEVRLAHMDGLALVRHLRESHPRVRAVLLSGQANMEVVIRAMRLGAADFLVKPLDVSECRMVVNRLLRLSGTPVPSRDGRHSEGAEGADGAERAKAGGAGKAGRELLGESPAFRRCLESARKAAATRCTVLITGESGTGKEGIARFIHEMSGHASGPFVAVNCGALPENLIESELFGHVRGAFTGATADRPGKFALAHGGTLFFDEIGEMSATMQVRLLRVLQERVVEPVGGGMPVATDFRLIAATHRDLREEVRAGRFREDLWFRLHVIPVTLPPLRERGQDVVLLARHFLGLLNERHGSAFSLSPENEKTLRAHSWPGNVRELANAMERAVVLAEGPELYIELDEVHGADACPASPGHSVKAHRRAAEREVILAALEACRWNKTMAAERLGISRRGLLYKVKDYGIG